MKKKRKKRRTTRKIRRQRRKKYLLVAHCILLMALFGILAVWLCREYRELNEPLSESLTLANRGTTEQEPPWYLLLVNRWHKIPEDYQSELVTVPGGVSEE